MKSTDNENDAVPGQSAGLESRQNTKHCSRLKHLGVLSTLLLLSYLAFIGVFNHILDVIINSHMDDVSRAYLKTSSRDTLEIFGILSAMKAVLALLQSSSGGISFFIDVQVQLGQFISALFDLVNYAWLFSIASASSCFGLEVLLDLSRISMAPILTLFFSLTGLYVGLRDPMPRISSALYEAARLILFAALLVHFVVPLSIYLSAAAGNLFFLKYNKEVHQGISAIHSKVPGHNSEDGLHEQVKGAIHHFKKHQSKMHKHVSEFSHLTVKHIVLVILERFIMPIALIYFLALVFLRGMNRLISKDSVETTLPHGF